MKTKTIITVYNRSRMICEACYKRKGQEFHHIFFKSDHHGKDKDYSWNLAFICKSCHRKIHNGENDGIVYNYQLKKKAIRRRPKGETPELKSSIVSLEKKVLEIKKAQKIIDKFD